MRLIVSGDEHDDLAYVTNQVDWLLNDPQGPSYLNVMRFPEAIMASIRDRRALSRAEFENSVQQYRAARPMDLPAMEARIAAAAPLFSAFLGRLAVPKPEIVRVHLTWFGPGGSYDHKNYRIFVRPDAQIGPQPPAAAPHDTLLQCVIQETAHAVIEARVVRRWSDWQTRTGHERKEGLVDQLCACLDLEPVIPTYYWQGYRIPSDWVSLVTWMTERGPLPPATPGARWAGK